MKAYSVDLRQKIIDVYTEGNLSQRQLAQQFRVALSFIQKLLKQYRETENLAAFSTNTTNSNQTQSRGIKCSLLC